MRNPRMRFTPLVPCLVAILATTPPSPLPAQPIPCTEGNAGGFPCHGIDLLAVLAPGDLGGGDGVRLNDVWGWADPTTGREYAFVGRTDGTAILDVTDPLNARLLGSLAGTDPYTPFPWRDLKTHAGHLFVVALSPRSPQGMQVFDLTALRELEAAPENALPREFRPDATWMGIATAINLSISAETGFAYLADTSGEYRCPGLLMVDVNDPLDPVAAGCFLHIGTGRRGVGRTHDAHCVLYRGPDAAWRGRQICVGFNETAISIADLTDPEAPVAIGTARYPATGYAHQGWLTEDHRHLFATDEMDELAGTVAGTRILVFDLEQLADPVLVAEHTGSTMAIDHNLHIRGDRLFLAANRGGLRVLDISEREAPVEMGYFVTRRSAEAEGGGARDDAGAMDRAGAGGAWGVYPFLPSGIVLVSSRDEGLFVLRVHSAGTGAID